MFNARGKDQLRITQNERMSIRNTIREINKLIRNTFMREIAEIKNLQEAHQIITEAALTLTEKIRKIIKKHVAALVALEIAKLNGEIKSFTKLTREEIKKLTQELYTQTYYEQMITAMLNVIGSSYQTLWQEISARGSIPARIDLQNMITNIYSMNISHAFDRFKQTIHNESQFIINNTKERAYAKEEEKYGHKYLYRWEIARDQRTTEWCKEIKRRVDREGGKVTLDHLESIVQDVSNTVPRYTYRRWNPHWNCRSAFIRVVK